jgi:hypothetical protein
MGNPLNATDNLEEYEIGTGDAGFVQEDDVEHATTEHTGDVPDTKEAPEDANTDTSPVGDEYTEPPLNNEDLYARPSVMVGEADFVEIENVDREEPNGDGARDSSLTGVVGNNTERRESIVDHLSDITTDPCFIAHESSQSRAEDLSPRTHNEIEASDQAELGMSQLSHTRSY